MALAAAAISSSTVTWPLVLTASAIGLIAGPGLKEHANDYINELGSKLVDGMVAGQSVDVSALAASAGPSISDHYIGSSATLRQYNVGGGGELSTVEPFSGARISIGELGHATGIATIRRFERNELAHGQARHDQGAAQTVLQSLRSMNQSMKEDAVEADTHRSTLWLGG